eukprot:jgi/Botrbrau1/9486/Bobra.0252s0102.3
MTAAMRVSSITNRLACVCKSSSQPSVSSNRQSRAVRAIPIKIITVAKGNSPAAKGMSEEWADKIRRYTQLLEVQVKPNPKKAGDPDVAVATEGQQVLKSISPQEHVIILDERGRDITSPGMADVIAKVQYKRYKQDCSLVV